MSLRLPRGIVFIDFYAVSEQRPFVLFTEFFQDRKCVKRCVSAYKLRDNPSVTGRCIEIRIKTTWEKKVIRTKLPAK